LEYDLHVPAQSAQRTLVEGGDFLALEAYGARRRVHQAQHQTSSCRLATGRLAHQRQRLTAGDLETHVFNGAHKAYLPAPDDAATELITRPST
jgi:hypothetical protein